MGNKLKIELVPSTCWYSNLRNAISPYDWDVLRHGVYRDVSYRCEICGASGKLCCHEVWQYDDYHHIQILKGFVALCVPCHMVKHLGYASCFGVGEIEGGYDALVEHYMRVNSCTREDFEKDSNKAFEVWDKRSNYQWTCDLGIWKEWIS
jgi:hypothetical protein